MPSPPMARAKRPAVTTPAPVAVKERPPQRKPPPLSPSNAAMLAALQTGDKKPIADPAQREMQDKVGNGAVTAGLSRGPATDPKFAALKKDVQRKKRTVATSHPPPRKEATSAQAAARPPKDDEVAQGKTANAERMNEAKPKEFDKDAFIKAVEKAIADKAPKNLDDADKFADSNKPEEVKAEVQGRVGEGRTDSAEQIATTTAAPPDTSAAVTKQVVPMAADRPPGTPATPDPTKAVPNKLPPSATDMSAGPAQVNQQMADAQVTEPQLKKANEPAFSKALTDKKGAEKHSETAPDQLRKNETTQLRQTTAQAKRLGATAMGAIANQRVRTGQQVGARKTDAKTRDEEKRAQVTAILQKVFDPMKTDVEGILAGLDKLVDDQFTRGEQEARDAFTAEHKNKMEQYKDRRYSGKWGWIKWGHDKLLGLPDEANQIFVEARDHYVRRMRQVISDVADTIGRELNRAKQRIAKGRADLQAEVKKLPADLQSIGKQAAAEFADQFDELTQSVDDKSTGLVDTLATKYTDAVKSVDDEIAAEKEKNKGLVDKAVAAVKGVIDTIIELKNLLLGVLAKAAQAVMGILKDPIGFLGNLIAGVGGGLKLFAKNAGRHLEQGVLAWLLGTAATAGIQLPTSFDILGILVMIAGLLGLAWPNIRARLVRKVPEKAVAAAETAVPLVAETKRHGVAGMWADLKTRVGDLKKDLISNLVSYLLPTIIIAGITWIISLFNPASAFIRACKMIIDIVRFIVTQARQIIDFVNAVLDAVIAISKGGTGGVPALIERALARSIPVLIGVLAAILGIGGIAGKVRQIFQKLARPVNRAIDWAIDKITGLVKKLWAKIKAALDKKRPTARPKQPRKPIKDRARPRRRRDDRRRPKRRRPDRRKDRHRDKRSEKDKKRALDAALRDALRLLNEEAATPETVRHGLPAIKQRHKLTWIRLKKAAEDKYSIRLAINPEAETPVEELSVEEFPYEISKAEGGFTIKRREGAVEQLDASQIPMEGLDRRIGFVVNIATIPPEVHKKTDMAVRYLTEAWAAGTEDMAAARTAVVIGVNAIEHLNPETEKGAIGAAIAAVARTPELVMAVFGFVWTPKWVRRDNKKEIRFSDVRRKYNKLPAGKKQLAENNEKGLRDKEALPYGLFRQEVLASSYTRRAARILGKVNDVVHIVSQDADTDVAAKNMMGVLAAYTKILEEMNRHPLLTIGGYHFDGFKWKKKSERRNRQLTVLSNEVDRAIRVAIAEVHPQMLYPTEPNMLIKALDRVHVDGIFDNARAKGLLKVQGGLYGIGHAEGRFLRNKLMEVFGTEFTMVFAPDVSTVTSPAPGDVHRGLEVTPAGARAAAVGRMLDSDRVLRRSHRAYALILQSQTTASAANLARELTKANAALQALDKKGRDAFQAQIRDVIFVHVEDVALLMADNPRLTVNSREVQAHLTRLHRAADRIAARAVRQGKPPEVASGIRTAEQVTEQIITALTADELRVIWRRLSRLLTKIMSEQNQGGGESS